MGKGECIIGGGGGVYHWWGRGSVSLVVEWSVSLVEEGECIIGGGGGVYHW